MNSMGGGASGQQQMQLQMSFQLMNDVLKSCFSDCINDFRSGELAASEKQCLNNCTLRNVASANVIGQVQNSMQGGAAGSNF